MKKQIVLITGALTGIGRATAIAFVREGAIIVVSGRNDDKGREFVAELHGLGSKRNLSRRMSVRKKTSKILLRKPSSCLAGSMLQSIMQVRKESRSDHRSDRGNLFASFRYECSGCPVVPKYEMRAMREQKAGSIVN